MCNPHLWECETYPQNYLVNARCKICGEVTKFVAIFPLGKGESITTTAQNELTPANRRRARYLINMLLQGKGKDIIEGKRKVHVDMLHGIYERR